MIEFITSQLENDFLSGGMVLMLLGTILAYLRHIPKYTYQILHRKLVTTVDISDQDNAFYWIRQWLAEHDYSQRSRLLTVSSKKIGNVARDYETNAEDPTAGIKVFFTPAPGMHILRFENHWILLSRVREKQEGSASNNMFWREMITMKTFVRDREYFRRLFQVAMKLYHPKENRKIHIYTPTYDDWQASTIRTPRDTSSVILQEGLMESLTSEIKEFFASADWYKDRCIPYQRGYLLYGKPGNGKTSLVLALASRFGLDVYVAKVAGTSDDTFRSLMSQVPRHSIVLIEDVDCFFVHRESQVTGNIVDGDLTFSGFLNAIDGVTGSDGRILVMTTNQKELLDPALIRPGRVDRQVELRNASKDQAGRLFLNFFPENEDDSLDFAHHLPDDRSFSMADLQGILLDNRHDPTKAVQAMVQGRSPQLLIRQE